MKYLIFNTEEEAIIAESQISLVKGYPKAGTNAKTGLLDESIMTTRWDVPRQIADGRWIITSPDDNGEDYDDSWTINNENYV